MQKIVAIVGASRDRKKFGNKAVRAFAHAGWTVYPVNPREDEIEGFTVFRKLADVPDPLHRISVYLPPEMGRDLLKEIAEKPHEDVYFNPGSDSPELVADAAEMGLPIKRACSIVAIGLSPSMFPGV
jgi:predicted CoA-binding protein